jgi:hypothetical protein
MALFTTRVAETGFATSQDRCVILLVPASFGMFGSNPNWVCLHVPQGWSLHAPSPKACPNTSLVQVLTPLNLAWDIVAIVFLIKLRYRSYRHHCPAFLASNVSYALTVHATRTPSTVSYGVPSLPVSSLVHYNSESCRTLCIVALITSVQRALTIAFWLLELGFRPGRVRHWVADQLKLVQLPVRFYSNCFAHAVSTL